MADISTWSPVDESNNQPPPNGFPEFMANSGLNDGCRAMMGAIRRFYDQTINGTLELPYLKLTGGALSGPLSAPLYQLSSVAFANRDTVNNQHVIFDADGFDPALLLGGAVAGYANYYRAEQHTFQSNNGAVTFATVNAAGLSVTQTLTAQQLTSTGNITATNTVTAQQLTSTGNITATNTVTAQQLTSTGDITAAITVTAQQLTSSGNITAAGTVTGTAVNSNGEMGVNGNLTVGNNITSGNTVSARAFVDTDGLVSVFDVLRDLQARVAALEGRAR